jgi:hypothetical protein
MDFSTHPRIRHGVADLALLGVAVLLLGVAVWQALASHAELARVNTALAGVEAERGAAQARLRSLAANRSGEQDRLATRQELTADASPPRILAEITALLPAGVRLRSASFAYGDVVAIDLEVEAQAAAAWDELLERLSGSARFEAVRPGQEQRDGEMRSTIHMAWRGEPS